MINETKKILLKGVKVHNLKNVDLSLDSGKLVVFTGVSGSGKSSLAFDTIYVEGQRRYIESLSTYARRHLGDMPKPDAELITGISPTIAIEQKTAGKNPRSTVGTMTGIYDYFRLLFARIGTPHCPVSGEEVSPLTLGQILHKIQALAPKSKLMIFAPYAKGKKGEFKEDFQDLLRKGFTRIRLDGKLLDLSEEISIDGKLAHDLDLVIDRLILKEEEKTRLSEAVSQAIELGKGILSVLNLDTGEEILFSKYAFSHQSGLSYEPLEPQDFSFNHPSGMCPTCQGLGSIQEFVIEKIIDPELSIAEDCCKIASSYQTVRYGNIYDNLAHLYDFKINAPWKKLAEKAKKAFLYGTEKKWTKMTFVHPQKKQRWTEFVQWRGVLHEARKKFQDASSEHYQKKMRELMEESICPDCQGARIRSYPAATTLGGKHIQELTALPIDKCYEFFVHLPLTAYQKTIAIELIKEVKERLHFLKEVGLHYLTLDRTAPTLSGGEAQRVRLASQIGSGLSHATYVLDEPSIGLHPRDNLKLLQSLKRLCEKENSVIVVEHDEETMREADLIVDVGPLAGQKGGEILCVGQIADIIACKRSLTGAYLSGALKIPIPKKPRSLSNKWIEIQGAAHHNLKNVNVKIPLEVFIAVTGVSGSGKSSLISDILFPALSHLLHGGKMPVGKHRGLVGHEQIDKIIAIDQTPIGRTPRSNPATYIKVFDEIRDLFAQLPESKAHGLGPGQFSFNVKEGSCIHCGGMGMIRIDMDFMEDEWTCCPHCKGRRYDAKVLAILYRQKSIHDVLEMTVEEAHDFFTDIPKIKTKLELLLKVGLDYIRLGQPSPTLSGGEAQRIKLAKELSRPSTGKTFYILDEPTTGLHFHDIAKLVQILQELVDRKNSVLVIEHNMDLVKTADWIIDLGPEGGEAGGEIVACGPPKQIAKLNTPTASALQAVLQPPQFTPSSKNSEQKIGNQQWISVEGAAQNNLKNVDAKIPHGKIIVCTGPSGSGKSSFAFETVYAEGQRRYIESLSSYSRQFVKQLPKPKVEKIEGLMASIAIEQKSHAGNPRSTIGTMTEAYDYLRVLYAHLGQAYSPDTGEPLRTISKDFVLQKLLTLPQKTKLIILSPLALKPQDHFEDLKARLLKEGFLRIRLNNRYYELEEEIPFDKKKKNELFLVVDRLILSENIQKRLYGAIDSAVTLSGGTLIASYDEKDLFFNLSFAEESTGKSYPAITPHTFSFNTAQGMCPDCLGLGIEYGANLKRHKSILKLTPYELIAELWKENASSIALDCFETVLKEENIPDLPLSELSDEQLRFLLNGSQNEIFIKKRGIRIRFVGLDSVFSKTAKSGIGELRDEISGLLEEHPCLSCKGTRLNPLARHVRIEKYSIADVTALSIDKAEAFINAIQLGKEEHHFLEETLAQLKARLHFLKAIGLEYLSLDRSAPSLSGGEAQRIRLARQLGSGLTGCLYVLDEPTIGLHPHNTALLNQSLKQLCSQGNTLLLVEHDPLTVAIADYLFDFGPAAGKNGGEIIAQGTLEEIENNPLSLTGQYLSGKKKIPLPLKRRLSKKSLQISGAQLHNLKNISVTLPTGVLTCITGISGSGKSSLINDLLRPAIQEALSLRRIPEEIIYKETRIQGIKQFDKLLVMDQNPIGHTIRADVSTYTDLFTHLRHFYAALPEAKARGLEARNFSFNHKKGMCTSCFGLGTKNIEMQFLPSVKVPCEVCQGFRLNPLSLQIKYKGKNLGEVLKMTVEEAKDWLIPIPKALRILETLISVGLGYLMLGQEIVTLSGGEAQRIRLSRELAKRSTGKTLYLFDEPTIGLHSEDILKLIEIFHSLVDRGNSVMIIEHNLDVIANADFILDLGPEAGSAGGQIVAQGTPEEVANHPSSYTAKYLRKYL